MLVATLWWLFFWTAIGLSVGSFLNVVIYRLPRDRSLRVPLWSACPHCDSRIRWYDNLPILSFFILRGRCRDCAAPIATRYVVVEAAMAIIVLMLLDAFFIGQVRSGLNRSPFGLTEELAFDWPIFVAHIILFACLLSMSAIDLEYYWVDVRFTNLATLAGFVLHALWTPKHAADWIRPADATAVMSLFALAGLGLTWALIRRRSRIETENPDQPAGGEGIVLAEGPRVLPQHASSEPLALSDELGAKAVPQSTLSFLGRWIMVLTLIALVIILIRAELRLSTVAHAPRTFAPLLLFFLMIVREGSVTRDADRQIVEAIHEERHGARRMVLNELALLLPVILCAGAGLWIMSGDSALKESLSGLLHGHTRGWGLALLQHWAPLEGLGTAASGYVIAGAIGWTVRIVFTLVFGKEAFGSGDVHLMAAAGCIAGWPVVALGFFLTCGIALAGWLLTLPFKRSRALPLGPWLSLSFLIVIVFYDGILRLPVIEHMLYAAEQLFFRNSPMLRSNF